MIRRQVLIEKSGPSSVLQLKEQSFNSECDSNEILIEVAFSGINFADIIMRQGLYQDAPPMPFVPGYEVSGKILAVGPQVSNLKVGDLVLAGTRFGGYSSHVKVSEHQVVKLPPSTDLALAAALPVNWVTAYIALHEFGRIRSGDQILLDCATGGVGVIAMQIAKKVGAEVVGLTSSPGKKEFIQSYGARALTHEEFSQEKDLKFDFILNSSGGSSLSQQFEYLHKSGKICCIGMQDAIVQGQKNWGKILKTLVLSPRWSIFKLLKNSKMVGGFNALRYFEDDAWLKKYLPKINPTEFKPFIGKTFPIEQVAQAHDYLESRQARGKVLLKWS